MTDESDQQQASGRKQCSGIMGYGPMTEATEDKRNEYSLTIETAFGAGIGPHAPLSLQGGTTAEVGDNTRLAFALVGKHSADEAQGAEVHGFHLGTDLVLGDGLYGCVDGKAGVIDEYIDMLSGLFEVVDDGAARTVIHVELNPFATFRFDLLHKIRSFRRIARCRDDLVAASLGDACQRQAKAGRAPGNEPGKRFGGGRHDFSVFSGVLGGVAEFR